MVPMIILPEQNVLKMGISVSGGMSMVPKLMQVPTSLKAEAKMF